ncbi:MAG: response regulator [Nitrospiraceae bacterium]|nr:response regulator [Nitrospiraceae bacterium]
MRILVVDDDQAMLTVVRLALEKVGGHEVCSCLSGISATKEAPAFLPDVIILDVNMPGLDGPGTLEALRGIPGTAGVPVIFLTADSTPGEAERLNRLGAAGLIPKPFDPMKLSETIDGLIRRPRATGRPSVEEQLALLGRAYGAELGGKFTEIEHLWEAVCRGSGQGEDLERLQRLVHSMTGSSGTFGFDRVSGAAGALERHLKAASGGSGLSPHAIRGIRDALKELGELCSGECRQDRPVVQLPAREERDTEKDAKRTLFALGRDRLVAEELPLQLGYFGYYVRAFSSLGELEEAVGKLLPSAIIADAVPGDGECEDIEEIGRIRERAGGKIPFVYISDKDDIGTRLRAVRAGADACFTAPVNIGRLIDKLDLLTMHQVPEPYRVLIVDDEPLLAARHELVLQQSGITTEIVTDPFQILEKLSDFRPELILMDVYMPGCTGLELAKIIRQKEAFVSVPIVFLSAETDLDKQLSAMRLGGDDFLTKPIRPDHLISSVTSRAERYRTLRSFMIRDSLTGLLNHSRTKEQLDIEMSRARRKDSGLVFALLDLDHFKLVNDTYGHYAGDQVLKSLSRLLQQRLRKTDMIGRYGGEEFAIILTDMDGPAAVRVLDKIRGDFELILHQGKGRSFSVTFSCGLASVDRYQTAAEMSEAADVALYKAKNSGRNRVVLSE